jgi:LPS sulfotransferase NodH
MKPSLCYWLCTTPRSGSTSLCNALALTGLAGAPGEQLSPGNRERALKEFRARSFPELLERVRQKTTTPNRVFGIKVMSGGYLENLVDEVQGLSPGSPLDEALTTAFPNLKLVFLTRRNKIRQAVSHWRAIRSELWHLPRDGQAKAPPGDVTVAYEDFAAEPESATRKMLAYLGLEPATGWRLGELPLIPIADGTSEAWVQRYRRERQAHWERVIW